VPASLIVEKLGNNLRMEGGKLPWRKLQGKEKVQEIFVALF